jgi:hypothetical protein
MSMDNRLITVQEAARMLNISYVEALTDERLKKVRVNKYYHPETKRLISQKIETPGRWPMVQLSDLEIYRLERQEK